MKQWALGVSSTMSLLVCLSSATVSSQVPQSATTSSDVATGLSMKETEAWIKRELPAAGSDYIVTSSRTSGGGEFRLGRKYEIESAVLSECRLTLRTAIQDESLPDHLKIARLTSVQTVTLNDVDVGNIQPREGAVASGSTASKPTYVVPLPALSDHGTPFTSETAGYADGIVKRQTREANVRVRDQAFAGRAADVFRRAVVLCGAPNQLVGTAVAAPTQKAESSSTKQVSPAGSKMTNKDIIQLVAAGLSEQVVITSIRQAPAKDFDLTTTGLIALKNGKVSDAVILAMQGDTPAPLTAVAPAAAPSKYDATLAESTKPAVAPASQNGCSGIENMGVYKNEIFDRAMGGGVVEWLAKIRNNTSVTKIVVLGWRDVYGQQKNAQVQIPGGGIASPRLDLTQARAIPPVADVRLLSCQ